MQKRTSEQSELCSDVVRLKGFEPPTFWFVAKHSIQLFVWLRHTNPNQTEANTPHKALIILCFPHFYYIIPARFGQGLFTPTKEKAHRFLRICALFVRSITGVLIDRSVIFSGNKSWEFFSFSRHINDSVNNPFF